MDKLVLTVKLLFLAKIRKKGKNLMKIVETVKVRLKLFTIVVFDIFIYRFKSYWTQFQNLVMNIKLKTTIFKIGYDPLNTSS
jgi:hypothetical protein